MIPPTSEGPTQPPDNDPGATRTPAGAQKIGNYVLRRMLGEGAMGEVWLAHDRLLDRDVALKLLKAEIAADEQRLRDFLTEARATAKILHPNIVTIFGVNRKDNRSYIVMEYVEGGSLADELRDKGPLPWREATQAIRDSAAGLEAAHAAGLVHRDVKPSNLMRSSRGAVKVVDFGLAKSESANPAFTHTMPGTIMGSPSYMAPEQCRGERADVRSDLYSLICSYYQLLTDQFPFGGHDVTAIMYQHCHEPFPDAGMFASGLPNGVLRILAKGSRKKPEDRYQSATELLGELDALLAAQDGALSFGGASKVAAAPVSTRLTRGTVFKGRDLGEKLTWAAAGIAIIGIGIALWLHHRSPREAVPSASVIATPMPATAPAPAPAPASAPAVRPVAPPLISPQVAAVDPTAAAFTNSLGMSFVRIAPGKFVMGSPGRRQRVFDEAAERRVTLTRPFMMAATVVTQDQWKALMGNNPSHFQGEGNLPVETVSWNDAVEFCKKLSEKEGRNYRLPTDAEWEYACRAGTTSAYNTGNDAASLNKAAWYVDNSENKTHPVGQKQPNNWGLFDMHGNVWQWCGDYAGDEAPGELTDPSGPAAGDQYGSRVLRGGSWTANEQSCVSWARGSHAPTFRGDSLGFRVCLDLPQIASTVVPVAPSPATVPAAPATTPAAPTEESASSNRIKNENFTNGQAHVIDLLPLIDVKADAIRGKWNAAPREIKTDGSIYASNLRLPYKTPDEYDFEIEFTCEDPIDSVIQLLSHGATRFVWSPAGYGNSASGFGLYHGEKPNKNETTVGPGPRISAGRRHVSLVQVRKDSVAAFLDGKLTRQIKTDYSDLSPWGSFDIGERGLGIGASSTITFTKIQVTEITGQGTLTRAVAPSGIGPVAGPTPAGPGAAKPVAPKLVANIVGMKFALIAPGEFTMGSPDGEPGRGKDETPHHVKLTKPFYMGTTPVTQAQWKLVMGKNPSEHQDDDLPVDRVDWEDAAAFCRKLSASDGKEYRLPTEAEWEYACRAGTTSAYNTGGDDEAALKDAGWYKGNSNSKPHPPAEKNPNAFGLYDMHGNLWQWCSDFYGDYKGDAVDPTGPREAGRDGSHVLRGGSWTSPAASCRSAKRLTFPPKPGAGGTWGLRVCMDLTPTAAPALPKNLLKNGSFSEGKDTPDHWSLLGGKGIVFARDTTDFAEAPASLRATIAGEKSAGQIFQALDVPADGVLRISGFLKTSPDFKGRARVVLQRGNNRLAGAMTFLPIASGQDKHDWASSFFLRDVPLPLSGNTTTELKIMVEGDRGAAWADGLRVEHVPSVLRGFPNKPGPDPVHIVPTDAWFTAGIWCMSFLPDGRLLCGAKGRGAEVIDPVTDEEIFRFPDKGKGYAWSRESGLLACGGVIYRLADGKAIANIPAPIDACVQFTPDGLHVILKDDQGAMTLFDVNALTRTPLFPAAKDARVTMSDDGAVFLWRGDGMLRIYKGDISKIAAERPAATFPDVGFKAVDGQLRADGGAVLVTNNGGKHNSAAVIWDWRNNRIESRLFEGYDHADLPSWSEDGKFAFVHYWGSLKIYNTATSKPMFSLSSNAPVTGTNGTFFVPGNRYAVIGYDGNLLRVIDLSTRRPLFPESEPVHDKYDSFVAFSRDGRFMAASTWSLGGDHTPRTIPIWRLPEPTASK